MRNLRAGNAVDSAHATRFALTQPDILGLLGHPLVDGETGVRILRELSRSYLTIAKDLSRVMSRLKAVYAAGRFPVQEETFITPGIEPSGWQKSVSREADFPRNITADLFRAERIISRRAIRAETVHLWTKFGPLELPLNEEQIPQIVEKQ